MDDPYHGFHDPYYGGQQASAGYREEPQSPQVFRYDAAALERHNVRTAPQYGEQYDASPQQYDQQYLEYDAPQTYSPEYQYPHQEERYDDYQQPQQSTRYERPQAAENLRYGQPNGVVDKRSSRQQVVPQSSPQDYRSSYNDNMAKGKNYVSRSNSHHQQNDYTRSNRYCPDSDRYVEQEHNRCPPKSYDDNQRTGYSRQKTSRGQERDRYRFDDIVNALPKYDSPRSYPQEKHNHNPDFRFPARARLNHLPSNSKYSSQMFDHKAYQQRVSQTKTNNEPQTSKQRHGPPEQTYKQRYFNYRAGYDRDGSTEDLHQNRGHRSYY